MTKAERIFQKTRWMCKRNLETYGYSENANGTAVGFNWVASEGEGVVYKETLTAIEKLLENKQQMLKMDKRLGIVDEEQYKTEYQTLKMVEATIQNTRESVENR